MKDFIVTACIVLCVICLVGSFALHFGIPKNERMNPQAYNLDKKTRLRISAGYWCLFGVVAFGMLAAVLNSKL